MGKDKVSFPHAKYLGGLPGDKGGYKGNLIVDSEGIGCGVANKKKGVVLWPDADGISYDSELISKSRVGKAIVFGVFALAAKNTQSAATITVTLKDGGIAIYQVSGRPGAAVRGRIQSIVSAAGIPCLDDVPTVASNSLLGDESPRASLFVADELAKLGVLRDEGALTEQEFADQKARLIPMSRETSEKAQHDFEESTSPSDEVIMWCNSCSKELESDAKFCLMCGAAAEEINLSQCLECSGPIALEDSFCPSCGTTLD